MTETQIEVVKQWLKNKKEFSPLEVIEHLQEQNKKLEAQIEKMKCCENCKKVDNCKVFAHVDIKVCDKWELAE